MVRDGVVLRDGVGLGLDGAGGVEGGVAGGEGLSNEGQPYEGLPYDEGLPYEGELPGEMQPSLLGLPSVADALLLMPVDSAMAREVGFVACMRDHLHAALLLRHNPQPHPPPHPPPPAAAHHSAFAHGLHPATPAAAFSFASDAAERAERVVCDLLSQLTRFVAGVANPSQV